MLEDLNTMSFSTCTTGDDEVLKLVDCALAPRREDTSWRTPEDEETPLPETFERPIHLVFLERVWDSRGGRTPFRSVFYKYCGEAMLGSE
jgi:hypothetical protein